MFEHDYRVVCKLRDDIDLRDDTDASWIWDSVLKQPELRSIPGLQTTRLFRSSTSSQLREFTRSVSPAQRSSDRAPLPRSLDANLNSWVVFTVARREDAELLSKTLQTIDVVETAYVDSNSSLPRPPDAVNDPLFSQQDFLNPQAGGVAIQALWEAGGDGSGVALADVEMDWSLRHLDLPQGIEGVTKLIPAHPTTPESAHGTQVLQIVAARDNQLGIIGMAHNVSNVLVASAATTARADAIIAAANRLRTLGGGVLLIELQLQEDGLPPVEACLAEFMAISQAAYQSVDSPIVVVECAGNDGQDLDTFQAPGRRRLRRDDEDSGAILVGAVKSGLEFKRLTQSNFGSRVDCCAWGENVRTSYGWFDGTSAAGAIIGGICCAVLSLRKEQPKLSSVEMRDLLVASAGNRPASDDSEMVGVVPDLTQIMTSLGSPLPEGIS